MCVVKSSVHLLMLMITVKCASGKCRQSFMTICDSFQDLKNNEEADGWTELMIGSEKSTPNETINFRDALPLQDYPILNSLYVINKVKNLEIKAYQSCSYSNLQYLNTLAFYGNEIKVIRDYHFPIMNLKKISLVNNKIEAIKPQSFAKHEVEIFDVSNNLLEVIETYSLPKVAKFKRLVARNNKLTYIEPNSFSNTLKSLHLDYNNFRDLTAVRSLKDLQELTLSHNKFTEIPDITKLKKLTVFDISHNSIRSLEGDFFNELTELKLLDLSYNDIAVAGVLSFVLAPNRQATLTVSLGFNEITGVNIGGYTPLKKETFLFYGNPLNCPTWETVHPQVIAHQDQCDQKFFATGIMPYCLDYKYPGRFSHYNWRPDKEKFRRIIRENRGKINCSLTLRKNGVLNPIGLGCVI